jgi:hypothetical protein
MLTFNTATYTTLPTFVKPAISGKTAIMKKAPEKIE